MSKDASGTKGTAPLDHEAALRALYAQRLRSLQDEAIAAGGHLPAQALKELEALARMVEIGERLAPAPTRLRWPPAVALVVTLLLASILLFLHVLHTEIELDAEATAVSFRLPADQVITDTVALHGLAIAGTARIDVQGLLTGEAPPTWPAHGLSLALADGDAACRGALTMDRIVLPRGAHVGMTGENHAGRVHLLLQAPGAALRLTVEGCIRPGSASGTTWHGAGVRTLVLHLGADDVDLDLHPVADGAVAFAPLLRAADLSLTRVEQFAREDTMLVRQVSTLLSGSLFYPALEGAELKLRFGTPLRFGKVEGEFRTIEFAPGRLHLRFRGEVRDMTGGSDAQPRSLMPTLLEWLKENHSLSLLWGTAIYLFGLLLSLQRWWTRGE